MSRIYDFRGVKKDDMIKAAEFWGIEFDPESSKAQIELAMSEAGFTFQDYEADFLPEQFKERQEERENPRVPFQKAKVDEPADDEVEVSNEEDEGPKHEGVITAASTQATDAHGPVESSSPEEVEKVKEDVILIKMTRKNYRFDVLGITFTKEHPYAAVDKSKAQRILREYKGFVIALPDEVEEYYS